MAGFANADILTAPNLNPSTPWEKIATISPGSSIGSIFFGGPLDPPIPAGSNYLFYKILGTFIGSPMAGAEFMAARINGIASNYDNVLRDNASIASNTNLNRWTLAAGGTARESGCTFIMIVPGRSQQLGASDHRVMMQWYAIGADTGMLMDTGGVLNLSSAIQVSGISIDATLGVAGNRMSSGAQFILFGAK